MNQNHDLIFSREIASSSTLAEMSGVFQFTPLIDAQNSNRT